MAAPFTHETNSGYTNREEAFDAVVAWRRAALNDGWTTETATGCVTALVHPEGYHAHIVVEKLKGKWRFNVDVRVWGPDRLAVTVPYVYDMDALRRGTRTCSVCGNEDVATQRVAFANRVCAACLPSEQARLERPGWDR